MDIPDGTKFRESHEWARIEEDQTVLIGISEFALEQLGDIVYIELPEIGDQLEAGESFGEIESVKAASDLYTSIGGEVVQVNEELEDDLSTLVQDPYNDGWLLKIRASDTSPLDELMPADKYSEYVKSIS